MSDSSKWEILTIAQIFRFANYIANPSNICIIMNILVPSFLLLVRILWSMFDYNIYIRNICIHYTYIKMNCKVGYVFTILMCNVLLIHAEKKWYSKPHSSKAIHRIHAAPQIFHSISSFVRQREKKVSVPFDKLNLIVIVVLCNDGSTVTQNWIFCHNFSNGMLFHRFKSPSECSKIIKNDKIIAKIWKVFQFHFIAKQFLKLKPIVFKDARSSTK